MKRFHHAAISVFLKPEETLDFLDVLLPIPLQQFLEQQFVYDQNKERTKVYILPKQQAQLTIQEAEGFEEGLTVAKFLFKKITHTNKLFDTIYNGLSQNDQAQLKERAHPDIQGKLTIRISKELKKIVLAKKDVVQCSFLLAAYPKNEATITKCVEELF